MCLVAADALLGIDFPIGHADLLVSTCQIEEHKTGSVAIFRELLRKFLEGWNRRLRLFMEQGRIGMQRHDLQLKDAQSTLNSRGIGRASFSADRPLPTNVDASTQKSTAGGRILK